MKKLILISIVTFALQSCLSLQTVTVPKTDKIIEVQGTKDELYIKANEWMVRTFNNAKSVIQFQDKEAGKIMGKYLMNSIGQTGADTYSLITISVKDGATKIDIEPTEAWQYDSSGMTVYNYSKEKAEADIAALLEDYTTYMTKETETW
jgi:hypothetical protein